MKFHILLILLLTFICSCGPSDDDYMDLDAKDSIVDTEINEDRISAIDFNNELILMQQDVLTVIDILFLSDSVTVEVNLENTFFELDMQLDKLHSFEHFYGGEAFQSSMVALINFYKDELSGDFQEIASLIKKIDLSDSEKDQLTTYDLVFAAEEKVFFEAIYAAQEEFAVNNNISLEGF